MNYGCFLHVAFYILLARSSGLQKPPKKPNERSYMNAIDVPVYKIVRLQAVIARITYALHRMSAFLTLPHHDGLSYESNKTNMTLEKESLED